MFKLGNFAFVGKDVSDRYKDIDYFLYQQHLDVLATSNWVLFKPFYQKDIDTSRLYKKLKMLLIVMLLANDPGYTNLVNWFKGVDGLQVADSIPHLILEHFKVLEQYLREGVNFTGVTKFTANSFSKQLTKAKNKLANVSNLVYLARELDISLQYNNTLENDAGIQLLNFGIELASGIITNVAILAAIGKLLTDTIKQLIPNQIFTSLDSGLNKITDIIRNLVLAKQPAYPQAYESSTYLLSVNINMRFVANSFNEFVENILIPLIGLYMISAPTLWSDYWSSNDDAISQFLKSGTFLSRLFTAPPYMFSCLVPGQVFIPLAAVQNISFTPSRETFISGHPKYVDVNMTVIDLIPVLLFSSTTKDGTPSFNPLAGGFQAPSNYRRRFIEELMKLENEFEVKEDAQKILVLGHPILKNIK